MTHYNEHLNGERYFVWRRGDGVHKGCQLVTLGFAVACRPEFLT